MCPQDFIGADYGLLNYTTYGPSADFWLLAVWRTAGVGRTVLSVAPPSSADIRAYAFCGARNGTAVIILINLAAQDACVRLPSWVPSGSNALQYSLTPTDGTVTSALVDLNQQTLLLQVRIGCGRSRTLLVQRYLAIVAIVQANNTLPPLIGLSVSAAKPLTIPSTSVSFVSVTISDYSPQTAACSG